MEALQKQKQLNEKPKHLDGNSEKNGNENVTIASWLKN